MKIALIALAAAISAASAASADDAIRDAEKRWANAVVKKDLAALEDIFTPDLIYAHATDKVETKQQYIERLRGGAQRYDSIQHESSRIAVHGDSAVAHSIVRMAGNNGQPFNDHVKMMHVWVKQNGTWRLGAHQTTKLDH